MDLVGIFRISSICLLSVATILNMAILQYFIPASGKRRFNGYFFFIINMAVADLLTCLTRITILSSFMATDVRVGEIACRWSEIPFAFCDVSLFMLLGMSFDRYRKITKPLGKQINRKIGTVLCIFFYAFAFSTHCQYLTEEVYIFFPESRICAENTSRVKNAIVTLIAVIVFAVSLPIVLIIWFNVSTLRCLKKVKLFEENANSVGNDRMARLEYKRNLTATKTLRMLMILAIVTNFVPRILTTICFVVFTNVSIPNLEIRNGCPFCFKRHVT